MTANALCNLLVHELHLDQEVHKVSSSTEQASTNIMLVCVNMASHIRQRHACEEAPETHLTSTSSISWTTYMNKYRIRVCTVRAAAD